MSRISLLLKLVSLRVPKGRSLPCRQAGNLVFNIVFIFFLSLALGQGAMALAQEDPAADVLKRPVVEYASGELRDPFKTYLVEKESKPVAVENIDVNAPKFDLSKLIVQGIIWGGHLPQAIINDQVLTVGDLIQGAQILSIKKDGITLSFNGEILDLTAPGQNSVQAKETPDAGEKLSPSRELGVIFPQAPEAGEK